MKSEIALDAIDYWRTVSVNCQNGWGQQFHHTGAQSHYVLRHYQQKHGTARFDRALDVLFGKE